jgi:hypothetical protein
VGKQLMLTGAHMTTSPTIFAHIEVKTNLAMQDFKDFVKATGR